MQHEFVIQEWLASLQCANCFEPKTEERVGPRNHGAEEIERSHEANNASPLGEYQLARTNVAEAQQKKIRLTTQKKLYTTNQASDPA